MVKTVFFFLVVGLSLLVTAPFALIGLILCCIGLGKLGRILFNRVGRYWARTLLFVTGSHIEVSGLENIPKEGGVCFVGNHPSESDILVMLSLIPRPFGFTAKKEIQVWPFIGLWVTLLGGVFIDRKSARKALIAIQKGADHITRGGAMIIYPEGTRNSGKGLLPYRPGAFKLATLSEAVIVPVATQGSHRIWEEEGRIRGATVKVRFGKSINTKGLSVDERKALPAKTWKELEGLISGL